MRRAKTRHRSERREEEEGGAGAAFAARADHPSSFPLSPPQVLGAIFRMNVDGETPGADYLEARHVLLAQLLDG